MFRCATRQMTPRRRKPLDPQSPDFTIRFAIHLRRLLARRKLGTAKFHAALHRHKLEVSRVTVAKWLNGERLPRVGDLEGIARALGLNDYRRVLPEPWRE